MIKFQLPYYPTPGHWFLQKIVSMLNLTQADNGSYVFTQAGNGSITGNILTARTWVPSFD